MSLGELIQVSNFGLDIGTTLTPMIGYFTVISWMIHKVRFRTPFKNYSTICFFLIFVVFIILSSVLSRHILINLYSTSTYLQCGLLMFITEDLCETDKHINALGWVLILSLTFLAFLIIFTRFGIIHGVIHVSKYGRSFGTAGDPNVTSLNLLTALPFAIIYYFSCTGFLKKLFLAISTIMILLAIFFTASISALISLSVIFLCILILAPQNVRAQIYLFTFVLVIFAVVTVIRDPRYQARFFEKTGEIEQDNVNSASSGRIPLLIGGSKALLHHPVIGTGAFMVSKEVGKYSHSRPAVPHNLLLHVGIEGGILSLLAFITIIAIAFSRIRQAIDTPRISEGNKMLGKAIFISAIGFLTMSITLSAPKVKYLWILLGMMFAYHDIFSEREEDKSESPPT